LSREDIGSILSMTIETASRTISEFKRIGLIKEISHNHFALDIPALEAVVAY
jgi:CRP-like cAMP-binding protein